MVSDMFDLSNSDNICQKMILDVPAICESFEELLNDMKEKEFNIMNEIEHVEKRCITLNRRVMIS